LLQLTLNVATTIIHAMVDLL